MTPGRPLRVGIPIIGSANWMGGVSYIELLVKALSNLPASERPELSLIVTADTRANLALHETILHRVDEVVCVGHQLPQFPELAHVRDHGELLSRLDFFFPLLSQAWPNAKVASWIPDFQHMHLPRFFHESERRTRSESFARIAADARLLVLSSEDARSDFERFHPDSRVPTRVLPFHVLPDETWYTADCREVQRRYGLPDAFLICCNQLWIHKNHVMLLRAVARLREEGIETTLVCTGPTSDYRVSGFFDAIKKLMGELGIGHCVHFLGNIPRQDQIQLVRRAMALVQPSLFEGWSTVVEDCRALGKTMILSDLAVHHEQAPRHAVYFDRNRLDSLVAVLREHLPQFSPGPHEGQEAMARAEAPALVQSFARRFCSIARDAQLLLA
jgi:glycosyltransferase involved in cell wall biosynthesis